MIRWYTHFLLAALALSQAQASHVVNGQFFDSFGEAVAGAHLWVSGQAARPEQPAYELIAETQSAGDGSFELRLPPEWIEASGVLREVSVLVWKEGHGALLTKWAPDEIPAGVPFEPWLPPAPGDDAATRLRIEDESGEAYRGARVVPTKITYPDSGSGLSISPDAWTSAGAFITDEEGRVTLPFPPLSIVELTVDPAKGGRFEISWQDRGAGNFPETLVLERPTERTFEAHDVLPENLRLSVMVYVYVPTPSTRRLLALYTSGRALEGNAPWPLPLPGAAMNISLESEDEAALGFAVEPVSSGPEPVARGTAVKEWKIVPKPEAGSVTGSAVTFPDEAPLPGVRLHLMTPARAWVTTDEEGRFEEPLAGSFANIRSGVPPEGFVFRGPVQGHSRPDGDTGVAALPPVQLARAAWIHGMALNQDGKPAAGAWITAAVQGKDRRFFTRTAAAGPGGVFRIGPLEADLYYKVIGHLGAESGSLLAKGIGEPIAAKAAVGDLVQLRLEPSLQARVTLRWASDKAAPRMRMTLVSEEAVTYVNVDGGLHAAGRLHHPLDAGETMTFPRALDPEGVYAIRYRCWEESDRRVQPGMTAFFPAKELADGITIEPTRRWIARGVSAPTEEGESPASGALRARLRTSDFWSAPSPMNGFDLVGGAADPDVLLIERDGLVETASLVRNLRSGGPYGAAANEKSPGPRDRSEDVEFAKRLAWTQVERELADGGQGVLRWLSPLMHADPDGVLRFLDSGRWTQTSESTGALSKLAQALAPARPQDALALARRAELADSRSYIAYLAAPHLEKAAALQELAGAMADVAPDASSTGLVTKAATVARGLFELGEEKAARDVIEPALEVARELPANEQTDFCRAALGQVLMLVDRDEALQLLKSARRPSDHQRPIAHAAAWLARLDTQAALDTLAEVRGPSSQFYVDRALPAIAYRVAGRSEDEASAVVDQFASSGVPKGLVALALAEQGDRDGALEALLRAFDRVEADAAAGRLNPHHPVAAGAFLLSVADVIDPEGFASWQTRVLALPRRGPGFTPLGLWQLINAEACLAIVLSDRSPALARAILAPWIDALEHDENRTSTARREIQALSSAAALVYGDAVEEKLQSLPEDLRPLALTYAVKALARAAEPKGRLLASLQILSASWWPGERIR